jgi:hypothetical protein
MLNLRDSLLSYQQYYEDLLKEKDALLKKVKYAHGLKVVALNQQEQPEPQQHPNTQESLSASLSQQVLEVEVKFQAAIDQLVQSYDEHMRQIVPKPRLLPIRVSVQIESKGGLRLENVHVKPYDSVKDLLKAVEEVQQARGDPVLEWNREQLTFVLTGPLRVDN